MENNHDLQRGGSRLLAGSDRLSCGLVVDVSIHSRLPILFSHGLTVSMCARLVCAIHRKRKFKCFSSHVLSSGTHDGNSLLNYGKGRGPRSLGCMFHYTSR